MNLEEILLLEVKRNDLRGKMVTIRQYLYDLMHELWEEEDGFSGKRPFGNSGWTYDIYATLIKANVLPGELDEDGYIIEIDSDEALKFVIDNILKPLFQINSKSNAKQ